MTKRRDVLKLATASGLLSSMPALWVQEVMAQVGPVYTLKERDRRWNNIRDFMNRQGLACLILPHQTGDFSLYYAGYVANRDFFRSAGAVVFPLQGEPYLIGVRAPVKDDWIKDIAPRWFEGGMQLPMGNLIVDKIRAMGYERANIGVIGTRANVEGLNEFINEGLISYDTWSRVTDGLPLATFTDITREFAELTMVKGEEEITRFRKAALKGEALHQMLLDNIKIGMTDKLVKAMVAEFLIMNDMTADVEALFIKPGRINEGDIINSEYGLDYAGGYCQVTLCMAMGKVSRETEEVYAIAQESLQYGMKHIKPGVRFGDIIDAMEDIVIGQGYWHGFPQIHGLRPMFMVGPVYRDAPEYFTPSRTIGAEVIMKEGMIISFEPGAIKGRGRDATQVKLGGTAVVTKDGIQMWNKLGLQLQHIEASFY